jgi:hypothetical protein
MAVETETPRLIIHTTADSDEVLKVLSGQAQMSTRTAKNEALVLKIPLGIHPRMTFMLHRSRFYFHYVRLDFASHKPDEDFCLFEVVAGDFRGFVPCNTAKFNDCFPRIFAHGDHPVNFRQGVFAHLPDEL